MALSGLYVNRICSGKKAFGKKAVVYVIIATFFIAVMAIVVLILANPPASSSDRAAIERIYTMDRFLSDFESDIDRAAYIAGFRALLTLEEYTVQKGIFLSDINQPFNEAFMYGSINGTSYAIMSNATLYSYQQSVQQLAGSIGIDFYVNVTSVQLEQTNPWYVTVNLSFSVNVSDQRGLASWAYSVNRTTVIPITDLRDPLYSVNTLGKVQNQVKRTNISTFVDDTGNMNDTTRMLEFLNLSSYRESTSAPSFLMRFMSNLSGSPYGIESTVNIPRLSSQDIVINSTRSVVDYLYFGGDVQGNNATATACNIQNLILNPNWFQLDSAHLDDYNITGALTYSACP